MTDGGHYKKLSFSTEKTSFKTVPDVVFLHIQSTTNIHTVNHMDDSICYFSKGQRLHEQLRFYSSHSYILCFDVILKI